MPSRTYEAKMLIVTPDMDVGFIIFANEHVEHDIQELGSRYIEDILGKLQPPESGVWIWEGKQVWSSGRLPDGDYDHDVDYRDGKWRRPTDTEIAQLVRGETPWPLPREEDDDDKARSVSGEPSPG